MGRTLDEDDVLKEIDRWIGYLDEDMITRIKISIEKIPSAQPYTDEEIQKMQDLEQAEIQKAYELGKLDAEPQWIPCSEGLPEVNAKPYYIDPIDGNELFESEQVLVFGKNENGYDYSVASHIYSTESGDEWENAYDSAEVELTTILAWMPLPEPYREEGEKNDYLRISGNREVDDG